MILSLESERLLMKKRNSFIRELRVKPIADTNNPTFQYKKPIVKPREVKSFDTQERASRMKAVAQDKTTDFTVEQTDQLISKGKK